jgi:hypothetical protein
MDVITKREVIVEQSPFPHVIVDGFLSEEMHDAICAVFEDVLARETSETVRPSMLSRFPGYDAYCWVFDPTSPPPLDFFYSRKWLNYFAELFKVSLSDEVVVEFHHHEVGSKEDVWHDDFNFAYFLESDRLPNGVNPWHYQCNYMDATAAPLLAAPALERVRGVAFIYYFGREPYQTGSGGETGLGVTNGETGEVSLFQAVEPIPNRLLAFEISPESQHKFMTNTARERNTIIGWFHVTLEETLRRHQIYPRRWTQGDIAGGKRSPEGLPLDQIIYA